MVLMPEPLFRALPSDSKTRVVLTAVGKAADANVVKSRA